MEDEHGEIEVTEGILQLPPQPKGRSKKHIVLVAFCSVFLSIFIAAVLAGLTMFLQLRNVRGHPIPVQLVEPYSPDAFYLWLAQLNPTPDPTVYSSPSTEDQKFMRARIELALSSLEIDVTELSEGPLVAHIPASKNATSSIPMALFAPLDGTNLFTDLAQLVTVNVTEDMAQHGIERGEATIPGDQLRPFIGKNIIYSEEIGQMAMGRAGAAALVELAARITHQRASSRNATQVDPDPVIPKTWPELFLVFVPDSTTGDALKNFPLGDDSIPDGTSILSIEPMERGKYADSSSVLSYSTVVCRRPPDAADYSSIDVLGPVARMRSEISKLLPYSGSDEARNWLRGVSSSELCTEKRCELRTFVSAADSVSSTKVLHDIHEIVTEIAANSHIECAKEQVVVGDNIALVRRGDDPLPRIVAGVLGDRGTKICLQHDGNSARLTKVGERGQSVTALGVGGHNHETPAEFLPVDDIFGLVNDLCTIAEEYATSPQ